MPKQKEIRLHIPLFSSIDKILILQAGSLPIAFVILLFFSTFMPGCTIATKDLLPEVAARQAPDILFSEEIILLQKASVQSSILISRDGLVHVFAVDEESKLHHIEITGEKVITRELLGIIETKRAKFIDAIEYPPGQLRVLAGEKQFFRTSPGDSWQEILENRCSRFISAGDDLFCAFVIRGEEINAPQRTDISLGFFILIPVAWGSHKYASKLVLAQETPDGWVIRAVLDPDNPLDANDDFMVDTDNLGNIHFLYFATKGGSFYYLIFGGFSGAGGSGPLAKPELRYAELPLDQLLAFAAATQYQKSNEINGPWLPLKGAQLDPMQFLLGKQSINIGEELRPLNRRFSVGRATGEVDGLIFSLNTPFFDTNGQLSQTPANFPSWLEVSIRDGKWMPGFIVLTAADLPDSGYWWSDEKKTVIRKDANGNLHALLDSWISGFWHSRCYMNYFVKNDGEWSAPMVFANGNDCGGAKDRSLTMDKSGAVFAAWVNGEGKFIGRWLSPLKEVPQD